MPLWGNLQREYLEVRSDEHGDWPQLNKELDALARNKGSRILRKTLDGKSYRFMIMTYACERKATTLNWVMESDCLFVPPIQIHDGRETYHAVGFDRGAQSRLLSKFRSKGDAEIVNRNRIDTQSLDKASFMPLLDPLSNMTPMQISALASSMALG